MHKNQDHAQKELLIIEDMIKDLKPPVYAFEKLIRQSDFRILISVLLSSRTKDIVTAKASEKLFNIAPTPQQMHDLSEQKIEKLIYPVGFYRQKAKHIKKISAFLKDGKKVPDTQKELELLPGVGRKTANLVLSLAFGIPRITVDIHVFRISQRLSWAKSNDYAKIEQQLENLFEKKVWIDVNRILVGFGQTLCKPVKPMCPQCSLPEECLYFKTTHNLLKL